MAEVAGVLRSLREGAELSQEELAARSGLSVRTISDIERGLRKRLYPDTAERIATALGLSPAGAEQFVALARRRTSHFVPELDAGFRRRFVSWHLGRVLELGAHVGSEAEWFALLDADDANLAVALHWADEANDAESLLQLATGLFRYWQTRGEFAFGRRWFERGLAITPAASLPTRIRALWGLAWLTYHQGDYSATGACASELTVLTADSQEPEALRNAAVVRGIVALADDAGPKALDEMRTAVTFAEDTGQRWLLATTWLNLGLALIACNQTAAARVEISRAAAMYEELGDERFRARSVGYLGLAALTDNDPMRAVSLYAQSLSVFAAAGEEKGIAEALTGLATAAALNNECLRAAELGGAAERLREATAGCAFPVEGRLAERAFAEVRTKTPYSEWADAWTRGRALRLDQVVDQALNAV